MAAEGEGQSTDGQALILYPSENLQNHPGLLLAGYFIFHKNKTIILKFRKHFVFYLQQNIKVWIVD